VAGADQHFLPARGGGPWRAKDGPGLELAVEHPEAARWTAARWTAARWTAARWTAARWTAARWTSASWEAPPQ
jgi:hypothetical protein